MAVNMGNVWNGGSPDGSFQGVNFLDGFRSSIEGGSNSASAFETQQNQGAFVNWLTGEDPVAHNEALKAWERDEASAEKAREDQWKTRFWEADREDSQFQRKVADYVSAGFSPLAALEGSGNYAGSYSASSAQAHSPNGSPRNQGGPGNVLTAIIGALAMIASKGMSTSAQAAKTATETAAKAQIAKEAAQAKLNAAATSAQAKIDAARIYKFGDDITEAASVPFVASASKEKTAADLIREDAFTDFYKKTGKVPAWLYTPAEAEKLRKAGEYVDEDEIYYPKSWTKRKK